MSTVVYQGLQSHLESQMMETKTLKLKLSSPKLFFSQSLEMALQFLVVVVPSSDCDSKKPDIPIISPASSYRVRFPTVHPTLQGPYVHPSSWLSEKSLHLCTENLGSETGSEFIENSIFSSSTSELFKIPVKKEQQQQQTRNRRQVCQPKKQFPPPLTTLHSLHLKPYREDGRVILKATTAPVSSRGCFQVDRSNGRVRLSLAADSIMHVCRSLNESKQEEDD